MNKEASDGLFGSRTLLLEMKGSRNRGGLNRSPFSGGSAPSASTDECSSGNLYSCCCRCCCRCWCCGSESPGLRCCKPGCKNQQLHTQKHGLQHGIRLLVEVLSADPQKLPPAAPQQNRACLVTIVTRPRRDENP